MWPLQLQHPFTLSMEDCLILFLFCCDISGNVVNAPVLETVSYDTWFAWVWC